MPRIQGPLFSLRAHGPALGEIAYQDSIAGQSARSKPQTNEHSEHNLTAAQNVARWIQNWETAWENVYGYPFYTGFEAGASHIPTITRAIGRCSAQMQHSHSTLALSPYSAIPANYDPPQPIVSVTSGAIHVAFSSFIGPPRYAIRDNYAAIWQDLDPTIKDAPLLGFQTNDTQGGTHTYTFTTGTHGVPFVVLTTRVWLVNNSTPDGVWWSMPTTTWLVVPS